MSALPSTRSMVRRILAHHASAMPEDLDSTQWYGRARSKVRAIAQASGVSERRAAGVVAALSPRVAWHKCLEYSQEVLLLRAAGFVLVPAVPAVMPNRVKAWRIARGERPLDVLSGPKTRSFYRNLIGDLEAVTTDVWAARAAGIEMVNGTKFTPRQYEAVVDAYRLASAEVGLRPAELQAVVWGIVRGGTE